MKVIGRDEANRLVSLPDTLDAYYAGAPKRFARIQEIRLAYKKDVDAPLRVTGGMVKGDFSLLRAFLTDHDGALRVRVEAEAGIELFFPSFLYDFVEDTFARAIHHKIEGAGYACRECVGKYELRLRDYDRLLGRVADDDKGAAVWMALSRLLEPVGLADTHQKAYQEFLRAEDRFVLSCLAKGDTYSREVGYLTEERLLSMEAVDAALAELSDTREAQTVALLLRYRQAGRKRRTRLAI